MQKPRLGVRPGVFSTLWSLVNVFGLQLGFFQIKTIIKPYSFIISDLVSSNLHTLGIQKFEKLKELKQIWIVTHLMYAMVALLTWGKMIVIHKISDLMFLPPPYFSLDLFQIQISKIGLGFGFLMKKLQRGERKRERTRLFKGVKSLK